MALYFEERIREMIDDGRFNDSYDPYEVYYPGKPYKWGRMKELKKLNWHKYQSTTELNTTYIIGSNKNKELKHFMTITRVRNREKFSCLDDMGMFDFVAMMDPITPYYWDIYAETEDSDIYTHELFCMFLLPPLIDLGKIRFRHLPKCLKRHRTYFYDSMIDNPNQSKILPRKLINDYFADKI